MPQPSIPLDVTKWLQDAPKAAFLLDFDGTMVHLAAHPDEVLVPKELIENLKRISQNERLSFAVVTGRALHKLDALMGGITTIAIGSHGAEWRRSPGAEIEILAQPLPPFVRHALSLVAIEHGCIFEDKIYTVSMHLPFDQIETDLSDKILAATGYKSEEYMIRKVGRTYELLQTNVHKGSGIIHLMNQPAFKGKWPVYIGDDVGTDTSLEVVDKLGGIRLGVSNHGIGEEPSNQSLMGIDSVSWIVESLAQLDTEEPVLKTSNGA